MRHIVLMIFVLSSFILSAGETAESLDSVLAQHRERVSAERKRIEERHVNCVKCKGKNEVVDKELCATCHGSGLISTRKGQATISKPCARCSGKGDFERRTPCPKCCPYVVVESKTQQTDKKSEVKESVPEKQKCSDCSGKGFHLKEVGCSSCKGSGMIYTPAKQMISGWTKERRSQCTACSGKGKKSSRERCKSCNGSGSLKQAKAPELKVSATKKDVQPPKFDLVKWLIWSAEHGDAKAQYCLGVMYATGDSVAKSVKDSEKWLKMSADKGNTDAQMFFDSVITATKSHNNTDKAHAVDKKSTPEKLTQQTVNEPDDFMYHIKKGLDANYTASHALYKKFEFDFDKYQQYMNSSATRVQKNRIIDELFLGGVKSKVYKDWCRCYFALIPDGLRFCVEDVSDITVNDVPCYFVRVKLLRYNKSRLPGNDKLYWAERKWQNDELASCLGKRLLPSGIKLVIPQEWGNEPEQWTKGTLLDSEGWFYNVLIIDAVRTYENGREESVKRIEKDEYVFCSMEERLIVEKGEK